MDKDKDKKGFYEWIVVLGSSCESDPESSIPMPFCKKPDPPRKRRRRRFEKSTQTDFRKKMKPKVVISTASCQTDPPHPPPDERFVYFISGIVVGIIFQKYIKVS